MLLNKHFASSVKTLVHVRRKESKFLRRKGKFLRKREKEDSIRKLKKENGTM